MAVHRGEYTILITNKNLVVQGNPIVNWTQLDVTLRFNEPSSGLFIVPADDWVLDQIQPGNRVVVIRTQGAPNHEPGQIVVSGPIEGWFHERADDGGGDNAGVGKVRVDFADDLAQVVARQVYPDPGLAVTAQVSDTWTTTANAEVALRSLVNLNAGPGALTARRVPQLALGALGGVGSSITLTAQRMEPLGDVARRGALAGGALGFRTRQDMAAAQVLFEVYQPVDRSASVRFGMTYANLKYIGHEGRAPTATAVIVGGQGDGADKAMIERVDAGAQALWGRYEMLVSRPGSTPTPELSADGDEALGEGAETVRVPFNVADSHTQRFGVHYGLGDKVTVEKRPGQEFADIVRTVHIQAWPGAGDIISPTVGSQAATSEQRTLRMLRRVDTRLGVLERRILPA